MQKKHFIFPQKAARKRDILRFGGKFRILYRKVLDKFYFMIIIIGILLLKENN